jgi:uncharacterized coiled-coil protein SlyX
MGRERLREGLNQCRKEEKANTVKSIAIKNPQGHRHLTDISNIPLTDNNGEFQGVAIVIDDVSNIANIEAELTRKQEDIENLTSRLQDTYTKLKIANMDRDSFELKPRFDISNAAKLEDNIEKRMKKLETINESIESKINELNDVTVKLAESKSVLDKVGAEIQKRQKELQSGEMDSKDKMNETWRNKLKIYDEIDKCLNITDDNLKTKKLKDNES